MRIAAGIGLLVSALGSGVFGVAYHMESSEFFMDRAAYETRAWQRFLKENPEVAQRIGPQGTAQDVGYEPDLLRLQREEAQAAGKMLGTLGPVLLIAFVLLLVAGILLLLDRGRMVVAAGALIWIFVALYWVGVHSFLYGFTLRPGLLLAIFSLLAGFLAVAGAFQMGRTQPAPGA